jgi:hypothetical protein
MNRYLLSALLLTAALAAPSTASATQCIAQVRDVRGETLINRCGECRLVDIQHQRRGGGFLTKRSYRIPGKTSQPLPFKGPGSTRIVSDTACESENSAATEPRIRGAECGKLIKRPDGRPALINTCSACRGVVLERTMETGQTLRQVYTLGGRAIIPINLRGAVQLEVVGELSCNN